jgi:hypothetical protein
MQPDSKVSLILGRPFLSTANAHIDERFAFKPRPELNLMVNMLWQEKEDQSSGHLRDRMVHSKNKQLRSLVRWA